jgi:hypothetical protein
LIPWAVRSTSLSLFVAVLYLVASLASGSVLMLRLRRICRVLGAPVGAGASLCVACVWPVVPLLGLLDNRYGRGDWNSLEFLLGSEIPGMGSSLFLRDVLRRMELRWLDPERIFMLIPLVTPIFSMFVFISLVVSLRGASIDAKIESQRGTPN